MPRTIPSGACRSPASERASIASPRCSISRGSTPRTRCGAPPPSSAGFSRSPATTGTRCWWWWMRRSSSAPAVAGEVSDEARKLSLGAMTNLMCRGRKRGLAGVIATQRLAKLAKNVAAEASNFLMVRTFLDIDMARAADLLGMERRQADAFRDLERGQFMALGPALSRRPLGLRIGPTDTTPRNATPRLMPLPEATLDARAIILAAPPPENNRPQRRSSPDLLGQLMAAKTAALEIRPEAVEQPLSAEELAERRERVDRILRAVMAEPDAGFRAFGVLYQEFVVRCRIEGLGSAVPDLGDFRRMLRSEEHT